VVASSIYFQRESVYEGFDAFWSAMQLRSYNLISLTVG